MTTATTTKTVTHRFGGLICKSHYFEVPLNYEQPGGHRITVFAREVVAVANERRLDLPMMVFLQGGPGFESPRPEGADGWLGRALKEFRVLLLDQRGTGLSTAVTHESLSAFPDAKSQAEYLKHFRADNIVRDCESIRKTLHGGRPWTIIGQSYGGFCSATYLSIAPEGLAGSLIFGGLPPILHDDPDEVYRACYREVANKNRIFHDRFPDDSQNLRAIVDHLRKHPAQMPSGEALTARRFLQTGLNLGFRVTGRSLNSLHYLLERAFEPSASQPQLSYYFLHALENILGFNTNPIYALLHEAIYCSGKKSNWSAERILSEFPEFAHDCDPVFFTGEMIYPWMFDEYNCLKPLKEAAEILAQYEDWPALYRVETLRRNSVPVAAVIYHNDMYVDRELSLATAGNIRGIKLWITNEYEHDAIRLDGARVLDRLLALLRGEAE